MTVRIEPPTTYRHWTGVPARVYTSATWPEPEMIATPDGRWWTEILDESDWLNAGYAPRGVSAWRRFWRHWHHGRLMNYPRLSVLAFCIRDARLTRNAKEAPPLEHP